MGRYLLTLVLSALTWAGSVALAYSSTPIISNPDIQLLVVRQARLAGVPDTLALALAKVESNFNPAAVSDAGAIGVMQVMPATAKGEFGMDQDKLFDPEVNIRIGLEFLLQLYRRYDADWELALSHYNGGTLVSGADREPHDYTLGYIRKVRSWQAFYDFQRTIWDERRDNIVVRSLSVGHGSAPSDDLAVRLKVAREVMDDFPDMKNAEDG